MSRENLPFQASAWDEGDWIISGRLSDEKTWEDRQVGMTLTQRDAHAVAAWLNNRVSPEDLERCADLLRRWGRK